MEARLKSEVVLVARPLAEMVMLELYDGHEAYEAKHPSRVGLVDASVLAELLLDALAKIQDKLL